MFNKLLNREKLEFAVRNDAPFIVQLLELFNSSIEQNLVSLKETSTDTESLIFDLFSLYGTSRTLYFESLSMYLGQLIDTLQRHNRSLNKWERKSTIKKLTVTKNGLAEVIEKYKVIPKYK